MNMLCLVWSGGVSPNYFVSDEGDVDVCIRRLEDQDSGSISGGLSGTMRIFFFFGEDKNYNY